MLASGATPMVLPGQQAGYRRTVHGTGLPLAAGIVVSGDAVGKFGVVGQQRLVQDGDVHAPAGDAARLQAAHTQTGVFALLQQCGGFVLGPGKRSAGVVGIGVQVRGVVFVGLIGLLGIVIQPRQIAQVAVRLNGNGRLSNFRRVFVRQRSGRRCGRGCGGIHRPGSPGRP